jgi:hypothetical protein
MKSSTDSAIDWLLSAATMLGAFLLLSSHEALALLLFLLPVGGVAIVHWGERERLSVPRRAPGTLAALLLATLAVISISIIGAVAIVGPAARPALALVPIVAVALALPAVLSHRSIAGARARILVIGLGFAAGVVAAVIDPAYVLQTVLLAIAALSLVMGLVRYAQARSQSPGGA